MANFPGPYSNHVLPTTTRVLKRLRSENTNMRAMHRTEAPKAKTIFQSTSPSTFQSQFPKPRNAAIRIATIPVATTFMAASFAVLT